MNSHTNEFWGIRGNIKDWITNFLTMRHQSVIVDGERSTNSPVTSGVPQGTVLGPLLFLTYINDLPDSIHSQVRLFADDCILYREISSPTDSDILQQDIDTLCTWEQTWQMSFNPSKCFTMHMTHKKKAIIQQYKMGISSLQVVDHYPYLGVELSKDFSWAKHINRVSSGANKILGLLKRNLKCCEEETKATAYKVLFALNSSTAAISGIPTNSSMLKQWRRFKEELHALSRMITTVNRVFPRCFSVLIGRSLTPDD